MSENTPLTDKGRYLQKLLVDAHNSYRNSEQTSSDQRVPVSGVGTTLSSAYEQLRNATEYIEEHLLLQRAIRRFFNRNLSFYTNNFDPSITEELIVELTQAGYITNNSVSVKQLKQIETIVETNYSAFWRLIELRTPRNKAQDWTLDLISVSSEQVINNPSYHLAFAHFAHYHFFEKLDLYKYVGPKDNLTESEYPTVLYVAVHKALLKSDYANIRTALVHLNTISPTDSQRFSSYNQRLDELFEMPMTKKLTRIVNKNGAPLRTIKGAFFDTQETGNLVAEQPRTRAIIDQQITKNYEQVKRKLNSGVIKSIIFLVITKTIIGLAIEIPYDLLVYGSIIVLPLAINLLFPAVYMVILRMSLKLPGAANTKAIKDYVDNMLYTGETEQAYRSLSHRPSQKSVTFNTVYALMFVIAFGSVINALIALDFNFVQGAIFFIFLSTASFLGFRLSLMVKELEMVATNQGALAMVRDFLYTPFIALGQWLSSKYSKINILGIILDMVIELPLKTVLRLIRQWNAFLNDKRETIE